MAHPRAALPTDEQLIEGIERIQLPRREDDQKDNGDAYGRPAQVLLNVLKINYSENSPRVIYKYDLKFVVTRKNGKEVELNNALINVPEFLRLKKRDCLVTLLRLMHESDKEYFRNQQIGDDVDRIYWRSCCVFDGGNSYYTAVELPDHRGSIPEDVWSGPDGSPWVKNYVQSAVGPIKWELKKAEVFRIDGENRKSPQAMNFLASLATQNLHRQFDVDCKRDAAYMMGGETTRDQKMLRKGIMVAPKAVGDDVCIQIDNKISMFFKDDLLIDYMQNSSGIQNSNRLGEYLFNTQASSQLRKEIKNLPLTTTHLQTQRTFECKGLAKQSATQITFMLGERLISISDYFLETYKLRLQHPHLPLIIERKREGGESYHPIECLTIASGVRVSNQKMTREAQEAMITRACRAPAVLAKDLEVSREVADLTHKNKYHNSFQIQIENVPFPTLPAKLMFKPQVAGMAGFKPNITHDGKIDFTDRNFKFADPAKPDKPITLVIIDNALTDDQATRLSNTMMSTSSSLGMKIQMNGPTHVVGGQRQPLFELMQKKNASMFFFVTPEKIDENHYIVKKLEQEVGVVTQLMCKKTVLDVIDQKKTTKYNIIAKMNQKLGGANANPQIPPDLMTSDKEAYATAIKDWFPNRMLIGLSLSHAGAQSYADRVTGEEVKEPSCVGMAFTLSQPGKRAAVSWFIEKRKSIIEDLSRHFIHALDVYAESNKGKMPQAILIFRKGISEGELKKAAFEMKQVMEAIKKISVERPDLAEYRPTVQCVLCNTNSADRLFYMPDLKDASKILNVPAGTVLEKEATNPERKEFIIVAHNAIKGTAKPVKCTVVFEAQGRQGRKLSLVEIESLYHTMCYLNGIAASPTRLPVPLADSEKAAERQMNNYKEAMKEGLVGAVPGGEDYYKQLSDHFAHRFRNTQYYA